MLVHPQSSTRLLNVGVYAQFHLAYWRSDDVLDRPNVAKATLRDFRSSKKTRPKRPSFERWFLENRAVLFVIVRPAPSLRRDRRRCSI